MAGEGVRLGRGAPIASILTPVELVSTSTQKKIGAALVIIGAVSLALTGVYFFKLSLSKQIGLMVGSSLSVVLGLGILVRNPPPALPPPVAPVLQAEIPALPGGDQVSVALPVVAPVVHPLPEIAATDAQDQMESLCAKMAAASGPYRVRMKPLDNSEMGRSEPEIAALSSYTALWNQLGSASEGSEVIIDLNSTSPRLGKLIYRALLGYRVALGGDPDKGKRVTCHVTLQDQTIKSLFFRRENTLTPPTAWLDVVELAHRQSSGRSYNTK